MTNSQQMNWPVSSTAMEPVCSGWPPVFQRPACCRQGSKKEKEIMKPTADDFPSLTLSCICYFSTVCLSAVVHGIEPGAPHMWGNHPTTKLHSQAGHLVGERGSILKGTTEGQRESQTVYARTPFARVQRREFGVSLKHVFAFKRKGIRKCCRPLRQNDCFGEHHLATGR